MHPSSLSRYTKSIRYIVILLSFLLAAKTVEVYKNNLDLTNDIEIKKQYISDINSEITYDELYASGYKASQYAKYFIAHENGILSGNEVRIVFETKPVQTSEQTSSQIPVTPQESWNQFFSILGSRITNKK